MTDEMKNFNKVNPFTIAKWISDFGKDISVQKNRTDGSLTINCHNSLTCSKLMKCDNFLDQKILIVPHKFLNTTRGVFRCNELEEVQDDDIMEELSKQNVLKLRRIQPRRKGGRTVFVATFMSSILPDTVKIAYMSLPLRPYIPMPLRCFKCHKMNHSARSCKVSKQICGKCADEKHDGECQNIKCCNCGLEHFAWDRTCEIYKKEANILRKMTLEKLTYTEARRRLESRDVESYAQKTVTESMNGTLILKKLEELSSKMENIINVISQKQVSGIYEKSKDLHDPPTKPSEESYGKIETATREIQNRLREIEDKITTPTNENTSNETSTIKQTHTNEPS